MIYKRKDRKMNPIDISL
jgi:hypothetical protein